MSDDTAEEEPVDVGKFTHDCLEFEYIEHGLSSSEPIVLLHGFPQHARIWQPTMELLAAAGYRALALSQRGYSAAARPNRIRDYRLDKLTSDAVAFIKEIGGGPVHLVGHDLGAEVAWIVASSAPSILRSLTIVSTPHPRALTRAFITSNQAFRSWYISFLQLPIIPELAFRYRHGAIALKLLQHTGLAKSYAKDYVDRLLGSNGALDGAIDWYRAFPLTPSLTLAAPPVAVPTMYAWGSDDSVVTRTAARDTCRYVNGPYEFRVLEGVSHWVPEEASAQLAELIVAQARTYRATAQLP